MGGNWNTHLELVSHLRFQQYWWVCYTLHLTVLSLLGLCDPCICGRWLCFGHRLLLPLTCFAVPGWLRELLCVQEAMGTFKPLSLGGKKQAGEYQVLRCIWCSLKQILYLHIFYFDLKLNHWNERTEMGWGVTGIVLNTSVRPECTVPA